jgi:hypothetical protein
MSQQRSPTQLNTEDITLVVSEYKALRDEIMKRLEFRYQTVTLILIVSGTFLSVGVQTAVPASVLLVYPLLALFLIAAWAHNGVATLRIARYIREHIELKTHGLRWETYLKEEAPHLPQPYGFLGTVSTTGLVLGTQLLAVVLALFKGNFTILDTVLLVCSLASFILALFLSWYMTRLQR